MMDCLSDFLDLKLARYTARTREGSGKVLAFVGDEQVPQRDFSDAMHEALVRIENEGSVLYRWYPVDEIEMDPIQ